MNAVFEEVYRLCQIEERSLLTESEARRLLTSWGLPVVPGGEAKSAEQAARLSAHLCYPVVLKVLSADIPHKTDAGGVRLGLCSPAEVKRAYAEILSNARRAHPTARLGGVSVQQQLSEGLPLILGALRDAHFGPVVMFGLGGIYTEIFGDVVFRLAPLDVAEARCMITDAACYHLLIGARNLPAADLDYLAGCLVKLGDALTSEVRLQEVEINPLSFVPPDRGAALDALIVVKRQEECP